MTKQTLNPSEAIDERELTSINEIKRFYERWSADRDFREQLSIEPDRAIARYNLKVDPEEVRPIWDKEFTKKNGKEIHLSPSLQRYRELLIEESKWIESKRSLSLLEEPRFKAWRERQVARTAIQFHPSIQDAIVHAPMCFELSKGCSVGCWFCAISAPRLGDIFTYNQENANLWRKVLELMRNILGGAAREGFCYWATDPMDNPDYEKFCSDFHEILGEFPQTTTAQPLKDPARIRSLLKLSTEKGCPLNRFSILSLKIFNQVHQEFSAEELASVSLVLQNPEADSTKANAGRARDRNKRKAEKNHQFPDNSHQTSIACVSGFLFNMVERSVKLISPCNADDRWPNGYRVYEEGTFSDVNDLKILLEKMIAEHMQIELKPSDRIYFPRDLKYESLPDGFQLSSKFVTRKFRKQPYLKELGEVIQQGNKTAGEIALILEERGVPIARTFYSLNLLFQKGILDDEPSPKNS
jgi:radical SAM family RiPP maturation amino acid epimerase